MTWYRRPRRGISESRSSVTLDVRWREQGTSRPQVSLGILVALSDTDWNQRGPERLGEEEYLFEG